MPAEGWPDTEPSRGSRPSRARDRGQRGKPRTAAQAAAVGTDCRGTEGGEALKPRRERQRGSTENARERWTKPPSEAGRPSGRACNSLRSHSCRNLSHRGRYNVEGSVNALCACGASGGLDRGTLDTGRITEGGTQCARHTEVSRLRKPRTAGYESPPRRDTMWATIPHKPQQRGRLTTP